MPRITYDYVRNLDPEALGKLSKSQMKDLLRKVRVKTQTRIEQLNDVKVYSPAKEKFESNTNADKALSRMSRNEMYHELLMHQSFHSAKTSTVAGARKVATEQDKMIFGEGKSGRPRHRMTMYQRQRFWALYDEFLRTYKNAFAVFGYQAIMQYLGQMQVDKKIKTIGEINTEDFDTLLSMLEENEEEQEEYEYEGVNVLSGRRTD